MNVNVKSICKSNCWDFNARELHVARYVTLDSWFFNQFYCILKDKED